MPVRPDLFIPHKTTQSPVSQPDYGNDMRAIEIWAKGLRNTTGTVGAVELQATFGGGTNAVTVGWNGYNDTNIHVGSLTTLLPIFAGDTGYPPAAFLSGTLINVNIGGGGGVFIPSSAAAANIIQAFRVDAPSFVGPTPTIGLILQLQAVQLATTVPSANAFTAKSRSVQLASQAGYSFVTADFGAPTIIGADLSFSGIPLHLQTAGGLPYIVSWNIIASWDTANTLTQA